MNQSVKNDESRLSMEFIITILETLAQLKLRWKFIAASVVCFSIVGVILALVLPQSYRAETTIVIPENGGSMGLGGLAALAGGDLGDLLGSSLGGSSAVSEELVSTLLNSGELADVMVPKFRLDSSWEMPREKNTREDYRKVWSKKFRSEFNKESALELDFLDRSPIKAKQVVEEVTKWLDQRAQKVFQEQAARSYQYYQSQQEQQYALLSRAEDSLLSFQVRNRNFVPAEQLKQSLINVGELESEVQKVGMLLDVERGISGEGSASVRALELRKSVTQQKLQSQFGANTSENSGGILKKLSPAARQVLEYERLKRRVLVHASVYAFLVQQSEQLKLESVKSIPMFTVVDAPIITTKRAAPPRRMVVQLFFTMGFLLSCSWILLQEYIARNRSERFQNAWNKLRG